MKKILCLTLIFLVVFSGLVLAQDQESNEKVKAFKDFYFENSKAEVIEKVQKDDSLNTTWVSKENYNPEENFLSFKLQGYDYSMLFSFFKDQLYEVAIYSPSNDDFNIIKNTHQSMLVDLISKNYGEPTRKRNLSADNIEEGYVSYAAIWENEDTDQEKTIKIGISLSAKDYEYSANLYVEYPPLVKAQKQGQKQKSEQEQPAEDTENYF